MVIGFDGSRAFTKERTGTENYSYQLLMALSRLDQKNEYIVYVRELPTTNYQQHTSPSGLPTNFLIKKISWPRLWTQVGLAMHTFKDPLDVLFIPAHTSPLIHKRGLKTVVTVHDLGAEYLPKMHQLKQQLYLKYITRYQLKSATKLIAVSKATKEDLIKKAGVNPSRIKVIYEGFDNNLFKPTKSDTLVSSLIPYFLFVGTVQPRKNLERLIKAFSLQLSAIRQEKGKSDDRRLTTDNLKLVIVGSKGWKSDEIYNLPKKLRIEDRVKFLGYVPDSDMPALYSNAQALVFPSLFEGFGLPILEAQACGCPVITSNTSSMPEVGKGALLVDPYSVEAIADGMIKVMDKGLRAKLVDLGSKNVKKFSWEKAAKETLRVLESI